jgi:hypothetical protein
VNVIDKELRFLAKWAQEESQIECWHLPAHQLQVQHRWPSIAVIKRIRARLDAAKMRDGDLASVYDGQPLEWPWDGMAQDELCKDTNTQEQKV